MTTTMAWDYLIVTASNDAQGTAYEQQLAHRQQLGLLPQFRNVMVVTDLEGKRIGSGGSTVLCIMRVLDREIEGRQGPLTGPADIEQILRRLRIMIIHAGGDSRRLPAYGPCGKIFIPVPGKLTSQLAPTLFDRLLPSFLALPAPQADAGQMLVLSGDALLLFNPRSVRMDLPGITALACYDTPEHSSKHGVFVPDGMSVKAYLQKPSPETQRALGAINASGQTALDVGIMSFDAAAILLLLKAFDVTQSSDGKFDWAPDSRRRILARSLDLYREICCALGTEATREHYVRSARDSGSTWDDDALAHIYEILHSMPFHLQVVPSCQFMHFGTTKQLITSGLELLTHDLGQAPARTTLSLNTKLTDQAEITGTNSWVEGCTLTAPLRLTGQNVIVGADITTPLSLPEKVCLDIVPGYDRQGTSVHFVRCYGIADTFKDSLEKGGTLCGLPLLIWLEAAGLPPEAVWASGVPLAYRSLWDARVFPAVKRHAEFMQWLWLFDIKHATPQQKLAYQQSDRYSAAEVAIMTNQDAFYARRKLNLDEPN
jgi:fucokinase